MAVDWTHYYKGVLENPTARPEAKAEARLKLELLEPKTDTKTGTKTDEGELGLPPIIRYPTEEGGKVGEYYKEMDVTPPTAEEETGIREQERGFIQSQIDYIEQQYAKKIGEEEELGEKRYGRTRGILSGAGLLGTPMGGAAKEETIAYTEKQKALINEEKMAKISILLDQADRTALERIEKEKELARVNYQTYIDYLSGIQREARETFMGIAQTGVSLDKFRMFTDEEGKSYYNEALEQTGLDSLQFDLMYQSKLPRIQQSDYTEYQYNKDGNVWLKRIAFDPVTGEKKDQDYDLGIPATVEGAQYDLKQLDDGTVLLLPKTFDPEKSLSDQIIMYGAKGGFAKPETPKEPMGLSSETIRKLGIVGISEDVGNGIFWDLQAGFSHEAIKENLASQYGEEVGYGYFDTAWPILEKAKEGIKVITVE